MKRRAIAVIATIAATLTVALGAPVAIAPSAFAKPCSDGYTHAVLPTGHKCLRRGQYCATRYDRTYHRYGYHCHTGRLR